MANIKYWDEWKDFEDNTNRLEILTEDTVTPERVTIKSFQLKNKVELFDEKSTVGVGAEFSIISPTKLQYLNDLYTINIKELKVIHYLNGVINFVGYMDTEQYSDDFSDRVNYEIELTANNGIAILDRIRLSDPSGNPLTGMKSAFEVLRYILRKLEIGYESVNIALSTTIPNAPLQASENILQKTFVNTDNYIDEKGNVMSCREVLDAILLPLTAQLFIDGNQVYIIDINSLAKDNITFKRYVNPAVNYVIDLLYDSTYSVSHLRDIDTIIGGHNVSYQQGVSKIDVKFNKYVYDDVVEFKALVNNATSVNEFEVNNDWRIKEYALNNNTTIRQQIDKTGKKDDEFYFYSAVKGYKSRMTSGTGYRNDVYEVTGTDFNINSGINVTSSKTFIKFSAEVMIEDYLNFGKEVVSGFFEWPVFLFQFRIGNRYYKDGSWLINDNVNSDVDLGELSWLPVYITVDDITTTGKHVFNKYYSLDFSLHYRDDSSSLNKIQSLLIPLNSDLSKEVGNRVNSIEGGDQISVKIACPYYLNGKQDYYTYRIKDINISFFVEDEFGNLKKLENKDSETQGAISDDFISKKGVELIHGTDEFNNSRGSLLVKKSGIYDDSKYALNERLVSISTVKREGVTGTLEELLLNTYLSNLQIPRYRFNCTIQGYSSQLQLYKYDLLKRSGQGVRMVAISQTEDYINSTTSLDLLEVVKDELSKA